MTVFRNVMVYLGLGPDEEYEDGYLYDESPIPKESNGSPSEASATAPTPEPRQSSFDEDGSASAVGAVRPLRPVDGGYAQDDDSSFGTNEAAPVVDLVQEERSNETVSAARRNSSVVKATPIPRTKPHALTPQSFADAKPIADDFKKGVPVIMNLQGLDRELSRRLIDFASGVCYSLSGTMEKIASQVFLLTPDSVVVSDEERRRIEERGFAN